MVDALIAPGTLQGAVSVVRPGRAPPLKPLGRVPVAVLLAEPFAGKIAHRQHDMRVRLLLPIRRRSEEQTSEIQSLMRIPYAVFCLKTTNSILPKTTNTHLTSFNTDVSFTPQSKRQTSTH